MVSNFSDNLISDHDWHQAKGFTTLRCLEPLQLMVWKKRLFLGFLRFVRVPPYESGVKLTNFKFSWQNGAFLWGQKCTPNFLNQNEELSKKIGACMCIYTHVYANTWQGGPIGPPPRWIGLNSLIHFELSIIVCEKKAALWGIFNWKIILEFFIFKTKESCISWKTFFWEMSFK